MAATQLLALFHEAAPTADTIQQLREAGIDDTCVEVLSSIPYRGEMLGRPRPRTRIGKFALVGAGLGLITALFLTAGIFLLYPLRQGGQPLVPIPPSLIVLFEVIMLGTMWATFFGLLLGNRLPSFRPQLYDPRITEGHIGVLVEVEEGQIDEIMEILKRNGAHHMNRVPAYSKEDPRNRVFWIAAGVGIVGLASIVLLLAFEVIRIPFPSQMVDQVSIAYLQGPRQSAPSQSVPIQGPVLIADQPAMQPVPVSEDSLQRGEVFFSINCTMCHGKEGKGDGTLSGFFSPRPVDFTSDRVKELANETLFSVITQGRGIMPSMSEGLSVEARWDVINYVRSLGEQGE